MTTQTEHKILHNVHTNTRSQDTYTYATSYIRAQAL